jgi:hypothetical protein
MRTQYRLIRILIPIWECNFGFLRFIFFKLSSIIKFFYIILEFFKEKFDNWTTKLIFNYRTSILLFILRILSWYIFRFFKIFQFSMKTVVRGYFGQPCQQFYVARTDCMCPFRKNGYPIGPSWVRTREAGHPNVVVKDVQTWTDNGSHKRIL